MNNLNKKTVLFTTLILLYSTTSGCDSSNSTVSTQQINEREYTMSVAIEDSNVLEIQCRYLGKTAPSSVPNRSADKKPDYYEIKITNTSNVPISIQSVKHSMRIGPYRGKSFFNQEDLKKTWSSTTISPGESVARDSNFVWAVKSKNALLKKYSFVMQGSEGDTNFWVTIPLAYRR